MIDFNTISSDLDKFLSELSELKKPPKVVFISLVITKNALRKIKDLLNSYELNQKIVISNEEFEKHEICPFSRHSNVFNDLDKKEKCLSIIKGFGHKILEEHSHVLFEKLSPNQSLPIFWEKKSNFLPLFESDYKINNKNEEHLVSNSKSEKIIKNELALKYDDLESEVTKIEIWLKDFVVEILSKEFYKDNPIDYLPSKLHDRIISQIEYNLKKELRSHLKEDVLKDFRKIFTHAYITDAIAIIKDKKYYSFFEKYFLEKEKFIRKSDSLIDARNVLKHRDKEIDELIMHEIQLALTWFNRIKEKSPIFDNER